jgi:DNA-binding MarR family transcriptional regulator
MWRFYGRGFRDIDITGVQGALLVFLWLDGPQTMGELQEVLSLSSSTLTGLVDRMEKAGWLRRAEVPGDRRAWRVEPTALAEARKAEIIARAVEQDRTCFAMLTAGERKELVRLLRKVDRGLDEACRGEKDGGAHAARLAHR